MVAFLSRSLARALSFFLSLSLSHPPLARGARLSVCLYTLESHITRNTPSRPPPLDGDSGSDGESSGGDRNIIFYRQTDRQTETDRDFGGHASKSLLTRVRAGVIKKILSKCGRGPYALELLDPLGMYRSTFE